MKRVLGPLVTLAVLLVLNTVLQRALNPYFFQVLILVGINIILAVSLNLVNGFTGQFSLGHAGFMAVGAYASAWITLRGGGVAMFPVALLAGALLAALAGLAV